MAFRYKVKIAATVLMLVATKFGNSLIENQRMTVFAAESESIYPEGAGVSPSAEITVPIYNYDVLNVVLPTSYAVAFNPYGLNIRIGRDEVSDRQVVSQNYGMVNKSTRDKLITVTLTVEDLSGEIIFVDSPEEAENADAEAYTVYLALIPADQEEIKVNAQSLNKDITPEALANISMGQATENAVALQTGINQVTFKLSGAEYGFADGNGLSLSTESNTGDSFELMELAEDGTGVTAFTFGGVMNPNADWTKLSKGIKISVAYIYENATGEETIVEGTGAMISR